MSTTPAPQTFASLWKGATAERDAERASFGHLWKGMNTIPLAHNAPLVNMPSRASGDLKSQVTHTLLRKPSIGRGDLLAALRVATARKPAVVKAPPPPPGTPASNGMGAGGYSGNVAAKLGQASNAGSTSASGPRPNPNPAPAPLPAAAPAAQAPAPPPAPTPPSPPPPRM